MTIVLLVLLMADIGLTVVLLWLHAKEERLSAVLKGLRSGEVLVMGVRNRSDSSLGISVTEGGMYHFAKDVAEQLVERGWVVPA